MTSVADFDKALRAYVGIVAALKRVAERQSAESTPDHLPSDMGTPTIGED